MDHYRDNPDELEKLTDEKESEINREVAEAKFRDIKNRLRTKTAEVDCRYLNKSPNQTTRNILFSKFVQTM